jgi:beta-N-acetylhexosaminidase
MTKRIFTWAVTVMAMVNCSQLSVAQDSLDIKIGQMILIGLPTARVDQNVLRQIQTGKVGSILFFEKNIPAKNSYLELKKMTWTYQKAATTPLFIAIDQEGGRVNRLKEKYGFPRSITAAKMGKSALDSVRFYSETTAATLAGLGFNVNFAPVVDLASNPANPIIAKVERAFSAHPDSVVLFAQEFIKAHQRLGVITVLKHFPGHGSSTSDTHLELTDVTHHWKENELEPYQRLIDSGLSNAIMTAHIVNKKLDEKALPGTLSSKIIAGLLRTRLGYDGVVFTDDMQMHAITKHFGLEESIRLAIEAGVDILTFSNNIQGSQEHTVDKVHQIIRKLVETGAIPEARINQSYKRIMALKQTLSVSREEYYRLEMVKAQQAAERNAQLAKEAERRAYENEKRALEQYQQLVEEQKKPRKRKKRKQQN